MRALFGWLILLSLCALAGFLQNRWSKNVRAEQENLRSIPTDLRGREESWGEIRIGRPSGAVPVELPPRTVETEESQPPTADSGGSRTAPPLVPVEPEIQRAPDFEYVVPEGRVLSKICEDFYESGRPPIPERVAKYNGLASSDSLRAGFLLRLPPWEVLFPDGEERP